jgi:hypothetical protein
VELLLAWKRVAHEVGEGSLGDEFDKADRTDVQLELKTAEDNAIEEVWASFRFAVLADNQEPDRLKVIDLGAGHASATETLCGRVVAAMKSNALLNEGFGAGYLERKWPPALKASAAWPLSGLRQSFLDGSFARLLDPDAMLKSKIVEFVSSAQFGLASEKKSDGGHVWFDELVPADEVAFESDVFLLTKQKGKELKAAQRTGTPTPAIPNDDPAEPGTGSSPSPTAEPEPPPVVTPAPSTRTIRLIGTVPPELWNRLGTKLVPKLKTGSDLEIGVTFSACFDTIAAKNLEAELRQILVDLGLQGQIRLE